MQVRPVGLGSQHTRRLLELRDARAYQIEQQHMSRRTKSCPAKSLADPAHQQSPRDERTIEAVLDARTEERALGSVSTAHRLREKIQRSRDGIQTERSERRLQGPMSPLLTAFDEPKSRSPAKTPLGRGMDVVAATKRRIVAVRRRANHEDSGNAAAAPSRRATKQELEWMEKHEQFKQRIAVVEKECQTWWQSFYAASARVQGSEFHQASVTAIHRLFEESGTARRLETQRIHQQLTLLRSKVRMVSEKVGHMRNGSRFYAELQELIEDVEESLAAFRLAQRERYDEYVTEEKTLEKELAAFKGKMEEWNQVVETLEQTTKRSVRRTSVHYQTANKLNRTESASQLSPEDEGNDSNDSTPSDVAMMERVRGLNELILQSGGMRGDWDEREHGTFTSLLLKYGLGESVLLQNATDQPLRSQDNQREEMADGNLDYEAAVARFLCKCTKQLVTKSSKAVRDHLKWYVYHLELVQKKKDVIRQWRAQKERDRLLSIQQGLETTAASADVEASTAIDDADEQRKALLDAKARKKKQAQLRAWREEKERREQERFDQQRDAERQREEREAKRKQAKLSDKQKILVYKLQKEQEAAMMQQASKSRSPQQQSPSSTLREDLAERSKAAIETAKAKRVALEDIAAKKRKQQELPPRPKPSSLTSPASKSPVNTGEARSAKLLNATKASEARGLSKSELRKRESERRRQTAHETYIPGATAIPDVKVKSFGHLPIQPRAIPSWRRNM